MRKEFELAIIGAGIAGVSAAVYAKRSGLNFVLFEEKAVGGQLLFMENIDNYVGIDLGSKGHELAKSLDKALVDLAIPITPEGLIKVDIQGKGIHLDTNQNNYLFNAVIVATGASFRKLGVEGEAKFLGKGVSYCAVCDGFFFKGKDVAIIGGGNSAVEEALYLSEIANKVTLVHRRDKLRALEYLQKDLFAKGNIDIIFDSVVKEVKGQDLVDEIVIESVKSGRQKSLPLSGVFVAIGINPNTMMLNDTVACDEGGFVTTDEQMKTSADCIWACGDCRRRPLRQLITAASEGAIAAIGAYKYLRGHYISA